MVTLKKFGILSNKLLMKNRFSFCITRNYQKISRYFKHQQSELPASVRKFLPATYPASKEARLKSAANYGMHPDEYVPYPAYFGDYPDLPWIGHDAKDPYYPWDHPSLRRNYEEPLHVQCDILENAYPYGVRQRIDPYKASAICIMVFCLFGFVHYMCPQNKPPISKKQYPEEGKVHYTFEPAK